MLQSLTNINYTKDYPKYYSYLIFYLMLKNIWFQNKVFTYVFITRFHCYLHVLPSRPCVYVKNYQTFWNSMFFFELWKPIMWNSNFLIYPHYYLPFYYLDNILLSKTNEWISAIFLLVKGVLVCLLLFLFLNSSRTIVQNKITL